jgi:hypothetical protein
MRKLAFFMLAALLVPGFVYAQTCTCTYEGDPGLYVNLPDGPLDIIAGETLCFTVAPTNFGFQATSPCQEPDTFCFHAWETAGWTITTDPPMGDCYLLDPGYLWWQDVCITAPCEVVPCDWDTLWIGMFCCNDLIECDINCPDPCLDPNVYGGTPRPQVDWVAIHVVVSPPALYIEQDSLYTIEQGQTAAYVPFTICNGDPCADATVYDYTISCTGDLCTGFPQGGSTGAVPGGECEDVYAVVDAGLADICDLSDLTIIAWDQATGTVYDTCVQVVHVVEPIPVPLFTTPVVTILVLAMILAAAVFLRRRAISRA